MTRSVLLLCALTLACPSVLCAQLVADDHQVFDQSNLGETVEANDQFGFALAVGDAGNDGYDDLLVGIPNQAVGGDAEAGVVALIRGGGYGLTAVGNQRWHEGRDGTPGGAQPGDHFGAAVAFADVTGDGRDDLLIGAILADPRRDPTSDVQSGGEAYLIYGSAVP